MARALMVLGTGSHVGKSTLVSALCRILRQDGWSVAPFKAQNMALNSAATPEGLEIGRAQAEQAQAAGIPASVDMNPVLLKPCADTRSQVILQGRIAGTWSATEYHRDRTERVFPRVIESYERLASRHEVIVLEGAGSPAEVNLMERDIVNMRMARAAGACCLLVADIDRGGVFAALVGTLDLLPEPQRALIRGFAINKFRGDPSLFESGIAFLERRLDRPCAGVVPFLHEIGIGEEDGVAREERRTPARAWPEEEGVGRRVRVAVAAVPHLANFTDFDPLAAEPSVALAFVTEPEDLLRADLVVLPGSKQVVSDLQWLERTGLATGLRRHAGSGGLTLGICGGMQMLGRRIEDPLEREGGVAGRGLGLLDLYTTLGGEKVTRVATGEWISPDLFGRWFGVGGPLRGYEIHLGISERGAGTPPLLRLRRQGAAGPVEDGAVSPDGRTLGTYLHGLFDDDDFRHRFVRNLRAARNLGPPHLEARYAAEREGRFDRLAACVRGALDVRMLYDWLGLPERRRVSEATGC